MNPIFLDDFLNTIHRHDITSRTEHSELLWIRENVLRYRTDIFRLIWIGIRFVLCCRCELYVDEIFSFQQIAWNWAVNVLIGLLDLCDVCIGSLWWQPEARQDLLASLGHVGERRWRRCCAGAGCWCLDVLFGFHEQIDLFLVVSLCDLLEFFRVGILLALIFLEFTAVFGFFADDVLKNRLLVEQIAVLGSDGMTCWLQAEIAAVWWWFG